MGFSSQTRTTGDGVEGEIDIQTVDAGEEFVRLFKKQEPDSESVLTLRFDHGTDDLPERPDGEGTSVPSSLEAATTADEVAATTDIEGAKARPSTPVTQRLEDEYPVLHLYLVGVLSHVLHC